uniref:Zinc/iron permease n=1 Tax=Globodera pallida TaxID=36090 RepID=A0A183CQI6_GLOPA
MEKNGTTPAPIGPADQSHDALKAVMLVVLFFVTFLASTASLPLRNFVLARAHSSSHVNRLFSLVSCFGAGVFLATCLLDMLPDSQKSMARAEQRLDRHFKFPFCAFFISVGFLLVLLLEQIALYAFEWFGVSPMGALFGQSQQQQLLNSDEQLVSASTSVDLHDPSLSSPMQQQPLLPTVEEEEQQQQPHNESNFGEQLSTMRVFLLLFALMMHACCEGISIGTFTDVAVLFQVDKNM